MHSHLPFAIVATEVPANHIISLVIVDVCFDIKRNAFSFEAERHG